jgi:glycosyltransferase involved in cell wall biosynthesis
MPEAGLENQNHRIQTPRDVVMVASFTRNNDYSLFYEVAERITAMRKDVTFIAAGGPGKTPVFYEWFSDAAKNHPRILCPGQIRDVEALVHACDIGVLFTNTLLHGEGISNSIIEYMALGKPVVATDNGGTGEIVRHNKNGYLVGDESPETIAGRILELLEDPEKRRAMGERGRQIIQSTFRLDIMGRQFESLYRDLLEY